MMQKRESKTLMTNYDPRQTISTLCEIQDTIMTDKTYKKKYEELYNDGLPISSQHNDAHFYLLRQFQLIVEIRNSQYAISPTGKLICKLLCERNMVKYQKALSRVLLLTGKREIFQEFLKFVKRSKSLSQIKEKFGKITSDGKEKRVESYRTLIAWCEEANLITKHGSEKNSKKKKEDTYIAATPVKTKVYSLKKFWEELKRVYQEIQDLSGFGSKMYYIPIGELRLRVSVQLGLMEKKFFDYYLTKLLENNFYRLYIRLHGAPTHAYDVMETFEFRNREYPLLSLVG